MTQSIENFFAAWGEPDAEARANAIRACLSGTFFYLDPRTETPMTKVDDLVAYVGMYTQYAPGATARVTDVTTTGDYHRATVAFEMADGQKQHGQYVIQLDGTGCLSHLVGFAGMGTPT
ncbi:molecular chaperone GroEL [Shimia biformata]|uniref:molecular chaperone GroEL n=1 Tax=Shimia biformata TaxID=1294299 RepID=UPI0019501D85|nr:molecular chaperone GroEL [Shimia biformata]